MEWNKFVPGAIIRCAELDDMAGLDPSSVEFRDRLKGHMQQRNELDELQEIARIATRSELERFDPIPDAWRASLTLGTFFDGDDRIFELYVAGARPADAIVLTSARVNRKTKAVSVKVTNLRER